MVVKMFIYLCVLAYCVYTAYKLYGLSTQKKLFAVGVYIALGIVITYVCILADIEDFGDSIVSIFFLYSTVMLLFYYTVTSIADYKKEKSLYHSIEPQLRYRDDVIRTEYEDMENVFCRCIVTEPKEQEKKGRLILIVPSLPPYYGKKYYWFIDYNGNCYDSSGDYREFSSLYNYAPYNEIADALAEAGNVVVRMDMFDRNPEAVKEIDHVQAVTAWIRCIQEQKGIAEDPIVIGHRENGLFAVQLMQSNQWKRGILVCSGPNYVYRNYTKNEKSMYMLLRKLTSEYSLIQIEAGWSSCSISIGKDVKAMIRKLQCRYMIRTIENMDFTLRFYDKSKKKNNRQYDDVALRRRRGMGDGVVGKGYRISCGTGEFSQVSNELIEVLKAEIDMMRSFA